MWSFNLQHFKWRCIAAPTRDMHDPGKVSLCFARQRTFRPCFWTTVLQFPVLTFFLQNQSGPSHRFSSACAYDALGCSFVLLHGGTKPVLVRASVLCGHASFASLSLLCDLIRDVLTFAVAQFDDKYISENRSEVQAESESLEHGCDDLWLWTQHDDGGEWKQLQVPVAPLIGGTGRLLEVKRTGHCMFVRGSHLYLFGGFYKDGPNASTYCNDLAVLNLRDVKSDLSAARRDIPESTAAQQARREEVEDCCTSDVLVLRRLLAAVDATTSIRYFLEDGVDDDDVIVLSRMQAHKVAAKYKMTEHQALRFIEMCAFELLQQQQLQDVESLGQSSNDSSQVAIIPSVPRPDDRSPNIDDLNAGTKKSTNGRLKNALLRKDSVQTSFGNRMQMSAYSTLSQFHSAALHVALKSLFPHTADVDVLSSDDTTEDLEIDDSEFFFRLRVLTMNELGAGTDAEVFVILVDRRGRETNEISLDIDKSEVAMQNERVVAAGGLPRHTTIDLFEKGSSDSFMIRPLIQGKFRPSGVTAIKGNTRSPVHFHRTCQSGCLFDLTLCYSENRVAACSENGGS
jgi:hypothetical protein